MKVMAAMSGGVDSSVAVHLLQKQGFEVTGATLCLTEQQGQGAREAAEAFSLPFYEYDEREAFRQLVIEAFKESYEHGETPNPCIICNKLVKFGLLLDKAIETGHDALATGHYAKVEKDGATGRFLLKKAKDNTKDQTYMLCLLSQKQLAHTVFPLGDYSKKEIRELAAELGLASADSPDSQDICFVPDGDYAGFLESYRQAMYPPGDFVDEEGKVLGRHQGVIRYTVGQRKGLGIALGKPVFVLAKDAPNNRVVLGEESALYTNRVYAKKVNWIACDAPSGSLRVTAKTRYSQKEAEAVLHPLEGGGVLAEFTDKQRAATPGQAMVFYDGDVVVGGGLIAEERI
ncbi:MAG: tRNA 2-thiouridine(34) synthase MnmA [Ruminococcaceae bacterium]|nr:tRNA 2-thiouridine(34) synthase MnmA [Oscillospiraceae bacterium]